MLREKSVHSGLPQKNVFVNTLKIRDYLSFKSLCSWLKKFVFTCQKSVATVSCSQMKSSSLTVRSFAFLPIDPIRSGLFSRSPGQRGGCPEAQMPKIKVNINRLK